jgi:rubrerythrin
MNKLKRKKTEKKTLIETGVIWCCQKCGSYNLHPLDQIDFKCILCKHVLRANAQEFLFLGLEVPPLQELVKEEET